MTSSPVAAAPLPTSTSSANYQLQPETPTPTTPVRIPKNAAHYTVDTQDYDLRSQINLQLLDTGHIHKIHNALLHALHTHSSDWPSRIQAYALQLMRSGEATTFPTLMARVLEDIKEDQKKGGDLALPGTVVEEGLRVTRESLEQVCEVVGGN